jgi:hypothetical protein
MTFDETTARQVLMVQAFETSSADSPLWTAEDRTWATRLATESLGAGAPPERFLVERARHALQRLRPRQAQIGVVLDGPSGSRGWAWGAGALGLIVGGLTDAIGAGQRINLLAPPVWGVVLWNLGVLAWLAAGLLRRPADPQAIGGPWRRTLLRWADRGRLPSGGGPLQTYAALWSRASAGLQLARLALGLHLAALGLALGLAGGLYLRGLVLDYRAGWQSTFLEARAVHGALSVLLAPASTLTDIAVPPVAELAAQQVRPGGEATASAAPWIHLYAATLLLFVMVPRAGLATAAAWQACQLSRALPLPLDDPYFRQLLARQAGAPVLVQVLPHGAAASATAALGLRSLLAGTWGDDLKLQMLTATSHGDEERATAAASGALLRVALFDLTATPEAEAQGRFVQRLQAVADAAPLLAVVDEAAFRQRFGALPERLAERRAAWQRWADGLGVTLMCCDLNQPDPRAAEAVLVSLMRC